MNNDLSRLGAITALLCDLDGVVYRGSRMLPGALDFFAFLKENQIRWIALTNNSTRTPAQYAEYLNKLGIPVDAAHVLNSGEATALYMQHHVPAGTHFYAIGEQPLIDTLLQVGLVFDEKSPEYVVVGLDRGFTYAKLTTACLAVRNGAKLIATNPDKTFPAEHAIVPGCGSLLAAVEACTGVKATVIGKPEPLMLTLAMEELGSTQATTAMLGDRLDTDIQGGANAGVITIMVTTGVNTVEDVEHSSVKPTLLFDGLPALIAAWNQALGNSRS